MIPATATRRVALRFTLPSPSSSNPLVTLRTFATTVDTIPTYNGKPRLIVLGTGWGGYTLLSSLSSSTLRKYDVKVISPTTSFSFTPLLAQASCATLDFRSAIEPIHSNKWMEYHHAWCDTIDFKNRRIELTALATELSTLGPAVTLRQRWDEGA